jgi:prevent-host-death family protein
MNLLTVAELKRRGMAAIEEGLRKGPVHIVKRNQPAAVVLSEDDYRALCQPQSPQEGGVTALQWLAVHPPTGRRTKAEIDQRLREERAW